MAKHDIKKEDDVIEKLEKYTAASSQFNDEEVEFIKGMADAYKGLMALGKIGVILIKLLTFITVLAVASGHAKGWLQTWLR